MSAAIVCGGLHAAPRGCADARLAYDVARREIGLCALAVRSGTIGEGSACAAGGLRRIPPKTPHAYDVSRREIILCALAVRSGTIGEGSACAAGAGGAVREAQPRGAPQGPPEEGPPTVVGGRPPPARR